MSSLSVSWCLSGLCWPWHDNWHRVYISCRFVLWMWPDRYPVMYISWIYCFMLWWSCGEWNVILYWDFGGMFRIWTIAIVIMYYLWTWSGAVYEKNRMWPCVYGRSDGISLVVVYWELYSCCRLVRVFFYEYITYAYIMWCIWGVYVNVRFLVFVSYFSSDLDDCNCVWKWYAWLWMIYNCQFVYVQFVCIYVARLYLCIGHVYWVVCCIFSICGFCALVRNLVALCLCDQISVVCQLDIR